MHRHRTRRRECITIRYFLFWRRMEWAFLAENTKCRNKAEKNPWMCGLKNLCLSAIVGR